MTHKARDSFGEVDVPDGVLWGASTQRTIDSLQVSTLRLQPAFMSALGLVKMAAAKVNVSLGLLDRERGEAIERAAREVVEGGHYDQFVVDLFQTGSGTSTNMNMNEVVANRAMGLLGRPRKGALSIHPNDHVNMGQSSNDVFPTALHIAAFRSIHQNLIPALLDLQKVFEIKSGSFADVVKAGRTHLQDAVPITLGQELSGYASQIKHNIERIRVASRGLLRLALGGTAVGTGLNAHPLFAAATIREICKETGSPFEEAGNHFEAQACVDVSVEVSGQLRTLAISFVKIANDLRLLASGPHCGLGEISLPPIIPGSSMMPGKVNPVVCEIVLMVAAQVVGSDATIAMCGQHGNLELNTMQPVLAYNLLQAVELLGGVSRLFADYCVIGIEANRERCFHYAESSAAVVTALVPLLGYERAATIAQQVLREGRSVTEVVGELGIVPPAKLRTLCDVRALSQSARTT